MHKRTKALQFDGKTRRTIEDRDQGCIFCRMGYHMQAASELEYQILDTMHIVPKSQGGLGVEKNGVLGCRYHHTLLDNGNKGLRSTMMQYIETYMKDKYQGWDKSDLIYHKGLQ